ncbi:MAG: Hsp20/alpha crystallin family protein [Calothrix sp. MO_192.B10]|nr:Hsp20/alpha crystallin family protein [Calothrix sp. MO_192.B10]
MSLIRWQPLRELDTLRQQMNRLFDDWMHGESSENLFPKMSIAWEPAIELQETDTDIILKAEIPGVEVKDINVEVSADAVSIAGEHKQEKRTDEKGWYRSEFHYGKFQRIVHLPTSIKNEEVKSEFVAGVLTLTLPKIEKARRNIVKVNLSVENQARQEMAKERQHEEHLQQTMQSRALQELGHPQTTNLKDEAREAATKQRQHEEHIEETMHTRAAAEVGMPVANNNN